MDNGFSKDDFRFTPACHCPIDETMHTAKVWKAAVKHCRQHLLAEAEAGQAEVIIPLGAEAASQVIGRSVKITKTRGLKSESRDLAQPVFPLLSPGLVVKYPQNGPIFQADMQSLARFVEAGFDEDASSAAITSEMEYVEVDDLEFLIEQQPEILSFDTENTGLRWYQPGQDVRNYKPNWHKGSFRFKPRFQILTMQFCIEPGKAYMLVWDHPERPIPEEKKPKLRNQLRRLLCNPDTMVIGQGNKYDNVALWMTEGIRYRISGDTLMLATLVDENSMERNLDVLTKRYVPELAGYADKFNRDVDKSRMWEVPLEDVLNYGCGDADAALRVYYALEEEVAQDEKLWAHYAHVTLPGLNAFAGMETRGLFVDQGETLAEFKEVMATSVEDLRVELLGQISRKLKQDVVAKYLAKSKQNTAEKALSLTRKEFLKEVLFTHPNGFRLTPRVFTKSTDKLKDLSLREPSTSAKDHLPYFFESCHFTEQLAEYVKDERLLGTSVIKFEENYVVGGKVRPVYHLHKTVTGRTSSDDPNGQNFPKRGARAKAYRKMFYAPEGWYVCENDLSQAELRIAACMSGDETMIDIYNSGGDIHRATAAIVMGVTPEEFGELPKDEQKVARQKAKAVNFGFLYGMWWRKFIGYAKTQYGVEFTEAEAQRVRKGFFAKYKRLEGWHNRMKSFAQKHRYVRSFSGRIRHLPMIDSSEEYIQQEAGRQAINSPVQEFGSSLGVMALGRMNEELDPEYIQIVGFVHDALIYYVRKEHVEWGMKTVKQYMESNPLQDWFGLRLQVPIIADVGFGENLGSVIEVGDFGEFKIDEPFDFDCIRDKKTGELLIDVPPQEIPPNNGRLTRSVYTLPTDLEDEDVAPVRKVRPRLLRVSLSTEAARRIERSQKQTLINERNFKAKLAEERKVRANYIRRVRPVTTG